MDMLELDFNETLELTCKPEIKSILLSSGAQVSLVLHQMDARTALLNSPLSETWSSQRASAAVPTEYACCIKFSKGCGNLEETYTRR